jgi:hypothetical protein
MSGIVDIGHVFVVILVVSVPFPARYTQPGGGICFGSFQKESGEEACGGWLLTP